MLYGGVGSVVMNLYRNMDRESVQFDFCVPRDGIGPLDDEIYALGGHIYHTPQIRKVGVYTYIKKIVMTIKDNGPFEAVHVHSVHMGALVLLAAKLAGVKNRIYHVHNTQDAALEGIKCHAIIEWVLNILIILLATKRYACGKEAGCYIYGTHSFEVINNAIDINRFHPAPFEEKKQIKKELGLPVEKVIVGDIARFVKEKNQSYFIDLASVDKKNENRLFFLLVGDGDDKHRVEELVRNNHLEDSFMFTGNRSDVERLYQAMDVFCLPSLYEGLPVSIMEAQACGIPCFVSSSVTTEANIGAVPYISFSLNQDIRLSIDSIYFLAQEEVSTPTFVSNAFSENCYEIKAIANQLHNYYMHL